MIKPLNPVLDSVLFKLAAKHINRRIKNNTKTSFKYKEKHWTKGDNYGLIIVHASSGSDEGLKAVVYDGLQWDSNNKRVIVNSCSFIVEEVKPLPI